MKKKPDPRDLLACMDGEGNITVNLALELHSTEWASLAAWARDRKKSIEEAVSQALWNGGLESLEGERRENARDAQRGNALGDGNDREEGHPE